MLGLTVFVQHQDDGVVHVRGAAFDRGYPEPITIESVDVKVDNGAEFSATLEPAHRQGALLVRNFSADAPAPVREGTHRIVVTATNDLGFVVTKTVTYADQVGPPLPPPLAATFSGSMSITTNQTFMSPIGSIFVFDGPRTQVAVPNITWIANTTAAAPRCLPFNPGPNITTAISAPGSGVYAPTTRMMNLSLKFRLQHSYDILNSFGSDLTIGLSTGSPMTAGQLSLSGSATFVGGFLNGIPCTVVLAGTLTPAP